MDLQVLRLREWSEYKIGNLIVQKLKFSTKLPIRGALIFLSSCEKSLLNKCFLFNPKFIHFLVWLGKLIKISISTGHISSGLCLVSIIAMGCEEKHLYPEGGDGLECTALEGDRGGLPHIIESNSAEGGHSAHRVCTNHNPTQTLFP